MLQWYRRINQHGPKVLWCFVIVCMLASLPAVFIRSQTEQTSDAVEIIFDYRDLLDISTVVQKPKQFIEQQLVNLKRAGVNSLALYETTLYELDISQRIEMFNSEEVAMLNETPTGFNENYTYVLFSDADSKDTVYELITRSFSRLFVNIRPWDFKGIEGLVIELPPEEAILKPLGFDPQTLEALTANDFDIVARISNRRPAFNAEEMEETLQLLSQYGVRTILVDGESLPGYSPNSTVAKEQLTQFAELLNQYDMSLAAIELLKNQQKGFHTVAPLIDYRIIRLHSITEPDADKLTDNITDEELQRRERDYSDRLVLAAKDRNIRMIYLNARAQRNTERGMYTYPLESLYRILSGEDGVNARLQNLGFVLDQAKPFEPQDSSLLKVSKLAALAGGAGLVALLISYFLPWASLAVFVAGLVGTAGLYVYSPSMTEKLLALAVAISAASLGLVLTIRYFRRWQGSPRGAGAALAASFLLLLLATAISGIGIVLVVALLQGLPYMLLLDQFRGVKALGLLPIVLVAIYLLWFSEPLPARKRFQKLNRMLHANITVLWVLVAVVLVMVGTYYMSRTGNSGVASSLEMKFRAFLENTLGARPRTKEFMIGHPLFILGTYLCFKRIKAGYYILLAGAIGQASLVGTFTHLHTPLFISLLRTLYGLGFGIVIGVLAVVAWELVMKGWKRWGRNLFTP